MNRRGVFFFPLRFGKIFKNPSEKRLSTNGIYVKCVPTDLSRDISHSFLDSLNLVFVAPTLSCCFAAAVYKVSWEKKKRETKSCLVFSVLPWTSLHISSSHLFSTASCEPNMFHSHGSVFRSTSVGFCPESQRAPLLSRKCRCHNMRPRHSQRLQSDLGPASRRPPPVGHRREFLGVKCAIYYSAAANEIWPLERRLSIWIGSPVKGKYLLHPFGLLCTRVHCTGCLRWPRPPPELERVQPTRFWNVLESLHLTNTRTKWERLAAIPEQKMLVWHLRSTDIPSVGSVHNFSTKTAFSFLKGKQGTCCTFAWKEIRNLFLRSCSNPASEW